MQYRADATFRPVRNRAAEALLRPARNLTFLRAGDMKYSLCRLALRRQPGDGLDEGHPLEAGRGPLLVSEESNGRERRGRGLIINRYLVREICAPLLVVVGILTILFASYSAADFLSDAVNGLLPMHMIAALIGLRVLIALEVLIPIALLISVVMSFGKLYGDSEFTAMFALQVGPARVMGAVLGLSASLAIGVAALSLIGRPWAYQKSHELSKEAEVMLDVNTMGAGTFYIGQQGNRVIFFGRRDRPNAPAQDVFVRVQHSDHTEIIHANVAYLLPRTSPDDATKVLLRDVHIYEMNGDQPDQAVSAGGFVLDLDARAPDPPGYSSVAASTRRLAGSRDRNDVAELQWRLSTPLSTLLLGLLGVPLSRARPRQGKYTKFGAVILVYSAYYLLCSAARIWVQRGQVPEFPGLWWVPALLGLVLIIVMSAPNLTLRFRHGRA
jgi:lipopolysaccharide export system permease protein